jgi:hypothetical protein
VHSQYQIQMTCFQSSHHELRTLLHCEESSAWYMVRAMRESHLICCCHLCGAHTFYSSVRPRERRRRNYWWCTSKEEISSSEEQTTEYHMPFWYLRQALSPPLGMHRTFRCLHLSQAWLRRGVGHASGDCSLIVPRYLPLVGYYSLISLERRDKSAEAAFGRRRRRLLTCTWSWERWMKVEYWNMRKCQVRREILGEREQGAGCLASSRPYATPHPSVPPLHNHHSFHSLPVRIHPRIHNYFHVSIFAILPNYHSTSIPHLL